MPIMDGYGLISGNSPENRIDNFKKVIKNKLEFLFENYGVENITDKQMKSDDCPTLVFKIDKKIEMQLYDEKGSIRLKLRNGLNNAKADWFDLDIFRSYFQNAKSYESGNLYSNIENPYDLKLQEKRLFGEIDFMEKNIKEIISIFNLIDVEKTLKKLRNQRAKILFG
jgi:hypothetical protein